MAGTRQPCSFSYLKDPDEIYHRSFSIIEDEADLARFPSDIRHVAVRMIHAVGMPDLAEELHWWGAVGEAGSQALSTGKPIIGDGHMTLEGIIRRNLPQHNPLLCTLNDKGVADAAKAQNTTRSAAAVERWVPYLAGAVVAIGNAPTALFRLLELLQQDAPKPALVLALPVGFVGAAEAKEAAAAELSARQIPFITVNGRRGGSALAAAAVNALATWRP